MGVRSVGAVGSSDSEGNGNQHILNPPDLKPEAELLMTTVLETIHTDGIAQLSYLVGDTSTGIAAVIDPRADVDVYLELARQKELAIRHVLETHIHADFVSGGRELVDRAGDATLHCSGHEAVYEFDHEPLMDGDRINLGSVVLTARHTPGHTPEHLSFEIAEADQPKDPFAVFTGDSLFVASAGRPDLLGDDQTDQLTEQLYETLYDYYLKLDDHVLIYPGHGAGSACGAGIGDRLVSSIGYERRQNRFLRFPDFEPFRNFVVNEAPPVPDHYPRLKKVNARGPEVLHRLPTIPALPPKDFQSESRQSGVTVIDTRQMLAFGGGHIEGAINIGSRPELSAWIGQMFEFDHSLLLVAENDDDVEQVVRLLLRTGYTNLAGYLCGGMKAWQNAGLPLAELPQISVHQLHDRLQSGKRMNVIDVRSPSEFASGHVPGARHYFVADMKNRIDGLDRELPTVTYCASGYRASIASSLMKARGFQQVYNVPGSWKAWQRAGLPTEHSDSAA